MDTYPESEVYPITVDKEHFFREYLRIKKPVFEAALTRSHGKKIRLRDKPMDVLAQLLYYNDKYKDLPDNARFATVFSNETKLKVGEDLVMKEQNLNVYLNYLRKLGIISKRKINKFFLIYPDSDLSINFKFSINGNGKQED